MQVGGIDNIAKGAFKGVQVGGIYNHVNDNVQGLQVGAITNYTKKKINGIQLAGIANVSNEVNGVQVGGILNYAKEIRGVQIGLVNDANNSDGYSIGPLNFVANGDNKIVISSKEVFQANVACKSGNSKLYSILLGGEVLLIRLKLILLVLALEKRSLLQKCSLLTLKFLLNMFIWVLSETIIR